MINKQTSVSTSSLHALIRRPSQINLGDQRGWTSDTQSFWSCSFWAREFGWKWSRKQTLLNRTMKRSPGSDWFIMVSHLLHSDKYNIKALVSRCHHLWLCPADMLHVDVLQDKPAGLQEECWNMSWWVESTLGKWRELWATGPPRILGHESC